MARQDLNKAVSVQDLHAQPPATLGYCGNNHLDALWAVRPGWAGGQHTGYRSSIPNTAGTQQGHLIPHFSDFCLELGDVTTAIWLIIKVDEHFKKAEKKKTYFSFCLTLGLSAKHHSSLLHGRDHPSSELKIFFPPKVLALRIFRMKMGWEPAEKKKFGWDVPVCIYHPFCIELFPCIILYKLALYSNPLI